MLIHAEMNAAIEAGAARPPLFRQDVLRFGELVGVCPQWRRAARRGDAVLGVEDGEHHGVLTMTVSDVLAFRVAR